MNGRTDLMHLVKSIEREASTLPEETRAGMEMRVRVVIENAARLLVGIRDDAKAMAAKGGDDGELRE